MKPPKDPKGNYPSTDSGYLYRTNSSGSEFKLILMDMPEDMNNFAVGFVNMNWCGSITNGKCASRNNIAIWNSLAAEAW